MVRLKSRTYCWLAAMLSGILRTDALVSRHYDLRVECGEGVQACDPRFAALAVGLGHHHMDVVIDHIATDDGRLRRNVRDS